MSSNIVLWPYGTVHGPYFIAYEALVSGPPEGDGFGNPLWGWGSSYNVVDITVPCVGFLRPNREEPHGIGAVSAFKFFGGLGFSMAGKRASVSLNGETFYGDYVYNPGEDRWIALVDFGREIGIANDAYGQYSALVDAGYSCPSGQTVRPVATRARVTIKGTYKISGESATEVLDIDLLQNYFDIPDLLSWRSIDKISFRGLDGNIPDGNVRLWVRMVSIPSGRKDFVIDVLSMDMVREQDLFQIHFDKCDNFGDVNGLGYDQSNRFLEYFLDDCIWLDWQGCSTDSSFFCCGQANDEEKEGGGEPEDSPDPCDCPELSSLIYQLSVRIAKLEIDFMELREGLDRICSAIQALSFNPVIEVKPSDSVNQINLPELAPVIQVQPCEPVVNVLPSQSVNHVNLPELAPVIQVQPCEPVVNIQPFLDVDLSGILSGLSSIRDAIAMLELQASIQAGDINLDLTDLIDKLDELFKVVRAKYSAAGVTQEEVTVTQVLQDKEEIILVDTRECWKKHLQKEPYNP